MIIEGFKIRRHKGIVIWHSPDFYVTAVGAKRDTLNNELQFMPSKKFGLVAITYDDQSPGIVPALYGYLIFKPCALLLRIKDDVLVQRKTLGALRMQAWYKLHAPWLHVRQATR